MVRRDVFTVPVFLGEARSLGAERLPSEVRPIDPPWRCCRDPIWGECGKVQEFGAGTLGALNHCMSGNFRGATEAATNASAELVLVESPTRLPQLSALLERDAENSHVLVHDASESRRQFWLRGLKRAREIVGRGKQIRTLSYVMAPEPGGAQLPERVAKAFARTLSPGSTMILHAFGSANPEVFDTLQRIGTSLRGVNAKAVFEDTGTRQATNTYLRAS